MLNSTERKNQPGHNVKMSTSIGILTFISRIITTFEILKQSVLHTVQINFHAVDVNKYRYIQTPIGLLISLGYRSCLHCTM